MVYMYIQKYSYIHYLPYRLNLVQTATLLRSHIHQKYQIYNEPQIRDLYVMIIYFITFHFDIFGKCIQKKFANISQKFLNYWTYPFMYKRFKKQLCSYIFYKSQKPTYYQRTFCFSNLYNLNTYITQLDKQNKPKNYIIESLRSPPTYIIPYNKHLNINIRKQIKQNKIKQGGLPEKILIRPMSLVFQWMIIVNVIQVLLTQFVAQTVILQQFTNSSVLNIICIYVLSK
eukprot:TRINITY_DN2301_c0_g1_i3.p1 TRINITY_DN2301_c0_g1~~TRINITY_DN2301_c0_g1_i3.p1  ORF type:complete len:229 (+),score=-20.81 TRINITY_DN2301_c0_g1_i3:847-1533(+)